MDIQKWNPFVRFARSRDTFLLQGLLQAADHRILYFHSGSGRIEVGGKHYPITSGALIYIPAGTAYRYWFDADTPVYSGFNFDFYQEHAHLAAPIPPALQGKFSPDSVLEKDHILAGNIPDQCVYLENGFPLEEIILQIAWEFRDHNLYYDGRCSALLKDALIQMVRLASVRGNSGNRQKADQILSYIHTNCHLPLSNKALAAKFGYHENYISNLIRKFTGLTLHHYVLNYKMQIAVGLLQSTNLSVAEVAEQVGMPDIKHFSKCFKNIIGHSPSGFMVR